MLRRYFLSSLAILTGLAMLGTASPADAAFEVKISGTNLNTSTFSDPTQTTFAQNVALVSPGPGTPTGWSGSLTFTSQPFFPGSTPGSTAIDMSGSIGYTSTAPGGLPAQIVIELTRTGFSLGGGGGSGATLQSVIHALSASSGVSLTFQSFVNYGTGGDQMYAESGAGGGAAIGLPNGGNGLVSTTGLQTLTGPFSGGLTDSKTLLGAIPSSSLGLSYSMTERLVINFSASGGVVSLDGGSTVSVPAPAGLILVLTGTPVLGVGAWVRRRRG